MKSPSELWHQAIEEHPTDPEVARARYIVLMFEAGWITQRRAEDPPNTLPCGWHATSTLDKPS